ncbi:MAG: MBL fold metallo-hydrolase [Clostridia bacterium]|nr:MBL fold metallo-hydrolase [Clostridia bacterium]
MLKIKWIGQSGYILTDGKIEICIDPYLSDVVNKVAGRPRMVPPPFSPDELKSDVVVCTHDHLDHIDTDAIPLMKKENMLFLAPSDCEGKLRELGVLNFESFDEGKSFKIGDFTLTAVFADHTVPSVGVLVEYEGGVLYFSGDTYYNEKLEDIKCDYMFVCINGKLGNMDVADAMALTEKINPSLAIPNHYGMFESNTEDPEKFEVDNRFIMEYNVEYEVKNKCLI